MLAGDMTTRTKLRVASFTSSAMLLLNVFSRPLHISETGQWVLRLGVFVPLGLLFHYNKQWKQEQAGGASGGSPASAELIDRAKKTKRNLLVLWASGVFVGLATPLWLPATGVTRGPTGDFVIGLITVLIVSVIFGIRLIIEGNQAREASAKISP
jgi:hypothetical protein